VTYNVDPETLTVPQVEHAIGIGTKLWAGNCYAIACAILRARLVRGRPAYGHWTGHIHPQSRFATKSAKPFVRHGWVVLQERGDHAQRPGRVLDPTRWVFEHVEPYLYVGGPPSCLDVDPCGTCGLLEEEHDGSVADACEAYAVTPWPYDEGGDRLRQALQRPLPVKQPGDKLVRIDLPRRLKQRLGLPHRMTCEQVAWLANLPYVVLGADAWAICKALEYAGHKALIPIDTWLRADAERGLLG
jgi:hypothetical protein